MNIWEILGIEQTTDLVAIKQAYAKKAKQYHPEEHPEEFQRLQKAFRMAEKYARAQRNTEGQRTFTSEYISRPEMYMAQEPQRKEQPKKLETPKRQEPPKQSESPKQQKSFTRQEQEQWKEPKQQVQVKTSLEEEYDYNVIDQMENAEKFFREAAFIMKSQRLRNSISCWEILFGKKEYADILRIVIVRQRFLSLVEYQPGLNRKVLRYFENLLRTYDDTGKYKDYHIYASKSKCSNYDKIEDKYIHKMVCDRTKKAKWDLKNGMQLEVYLRYYLLCMDYYGEGNKIRAQKREIYMKEFKVNMIGLGMIIAFGIVLYAVLSIIEWKKSVKPKKSPWESVPYDVILEDEYWDYDDLIPLEYDTIIEWQEE